MAVVHSPKTLDSLLHAKFEYVYQTVDLNFTARAPLIDMS